LTRSGKAWPGFTLWPFGAGAPWCNLKEMTLESGIEIPDERIGEICLRYGVTEMAVFGSAARGDMRPDSDIDIMVELSPDSRLGLDFFRMEEELSELFGRKVDLGTKRALKPGVRPFALQDARVIYAA